ncbi:hypothetical protein H2201_002012 [Coniosporium apollinis]|uniref:Carboxylic ester hydrolase n=1 Tax=Coniosporium apollinis TaxID=61459 RepID=A0ABQ9P1F5_9PEZI|nr:hypothetical protein H2201_002012 [Coniosporium apollinis]
MHLRKFLVSQLFAPGFIQAQTGSTLLPVVDLGYELYRASEFDARGFYKFSNIRYARPPLGELRFRAPEPPLINRSAIQDGMVERRCPQALPNWVVMPTQTSSSALPPSATGSSVPSAREPQEEEDCLFLDVVVPQKVFEKVGYGSDPPASPVLVRLHGGGYSIGSKTFYNDPIGLLSRSQTDGSDGIIYVSMNYRLGAFGWLAGPSFQKDGTANAGLYDQRMALEWVRQHVYLFGGDKTRVTVIGESAGGGSIIHHLTEQVFREFLHAANVSSLTELRTLPTEQLIAVNEAQIANSVYGQYTFGPAVDGDFITQDPKQLLSHGQFDAAVRIMTGHNSNEGLSFTPTNLTSDSEYNVFLRDFFPSADADVLSYVASTLYPPVSNTSLYSTNRARAGLTLGDVIIDCNNVALSRAYGNQTYGYLFAVAPGYHSQDYSYTYYNAGSPLAAGINSTVAYALQDYIASFVAHGKPLTTIPGAPDMDFYGADASLMRLDTSGITETTDPAANERCQWWQLGLMS